MRQTINQLLTGIFRLTNRKFKNFNDFLDLPELNLTPYLAQGSYRLRIMAGKSVEFGNDIGNDTVSAWKFFFVSKLYQHFVLVGNVGNVATPRRNFAVNF